VDELGADSVEEAAAEVSADEAGLEVDGFAGELVSVLLGEEVDVGAEEVAGLLVSAAGLDGVSGSVLDDAAELLVGALVEVLEVLSSVVA
jgi:hypothetical protein